MSEMVERVAQIIAQDVAERAADHPGTETWKDYMPSSRKVARTVIAAMREPTEDMTNVNDEVHWNYSCHVCGGLTEGWYAMIDAALKG